MKTAISVPDKIFSEAEKAAEEMGISRSELYKQALEKFLKERRSKQITDELNAFYAEEDNRDPVFEKMQLHSLKREEW
jgi:metal-responsive CopG/Arc/MetJ family transcriptional regulator